MTSPLKVLVNGTEKSEIAVSDRGLNYGDGLFETIAVFFGVPELLQQHFQRLQKGCEQLKLPFDSWDKLSAEVEQLAVTVSDTERAVIKIIITRGSGGRGYQLTDDCEPQRIVILSAWPERPDTPAKLRFCTTPLSCNPVLAGVKHLNRLEQVMARAEWDEQYGDFDEGLMSNIQGYVVEGILSNLFIVKDGLLLTPDLSHCGIEGIMRQHVMKLAETIGIETQISLLTKDEILQTDEIFITNSLMGIRPVSMLESTEFAVGPVTSQLMARIQDERA